MATAIIISIIVSTLLGATVPISQNLFSQVSSIDSLTKVSPLESLNRVTAPLDSFLKGLVGYLDIKPRLSKPLESLDSPQLKLALNNVDNISAEQVVTVIKSGLILAAKILVTVLEVALWILRAVLNRIG